MDNFCVVCRENDEARIWSGKRIREEKIYIYEPDITVTVVTVVGGKRISPRFMKKLAAKLAVYRNVFSVCGETAELNRCENTTTLMSKMPLEALRKCAGISGVELENERVAVIVQSEAQDKAQQVIHICTGLHYANIYGVGAESLCDRIMEETGLCACYSLQPPTENLRIFVGDEITFEYIPHNKVYSEIVPALPDFIKRYDHIIPANEIFCAFLKSEAGIAYRSTNNVKIIGIM